MKVLHLRDNPIRQLRLGEGKTVEQISKSAGIHPQGWYLAECGVYTDPLPAIISYFVKGGYSGTELHGGYKTFVQSRREGFGERYAVDTDTYRLPSSSTRRSPIIAFRETFNLSRMAFAKELCVQPAILYKLEYGKTTKLPQQLREALFDANFSEDLIDELDERVREYSDHVRR